MRTLTAAGSEVALLSAERGGFPLRRSAPRSDARARWPTPATRRGLNNVRAVQHLVEAPSAGQLLSLRRCPQGRPWSRAVRVCGRTRERYDELLALSVGDLDLYPVRAGRRAHVHAGFGPELVTHLANHLAGKPNVVASAGISVHDLLAVHPQRRAIGEHRGALYDTVDGQEALPQVGRHRWIPQGAARGVQCPRWLTSTALPSGSSTTTRHPHSRTWCSTSRAAPIRRSPANVSSSEST